MRIVAILNQKGGVGKTTTAVNLGAALAEGGQRVLLIDSDPQCNLSDHLGVETTGAGIYEVLTEGAAIAESVRPTSTEGLFVLPAHEDLAGAEQELATEIAREMRLKRAIEALPADTYEWILIDCPPSLGLLSVNAMATATEVIVTVQTEYFALRGLSQIDQVLNMVQQHINHDLRILGVLLTLVNPVTRLSREVIDEIRRHYGDAVFETRIRQNVRLAEAPSHGEHILAYDPESAGAADYRALAGEVHSRVSVEGPAAGESAKEQVPETPPPSRSTPEPNEEPREAAQASSNGAPGNGAPESLPAAVSSVEENGSNGDARA